MPFLGLDLPAFRAEADAYAEAPAAGDEPVHDPMHYPYLVLPAGEHGADPKPSGAG